MPCITPVRFMLNHYALLSLAPLLILLLVALSHVVNEAELLALLRHYLEQLVPSEVELVMEQVAQFLGHRQTLSWVMVGTLLFFSSLAFGILENAMRPSLLTGALFITGTP